MGLSRRQRGREQAQPKSNFLSLRTVLEDNTLLAELDGYRSYANLVRFRLLPYIW
jgi:protein-S-isoprenylcysteine O-methyltransferase Ste14